MFKKDGNINRESNVIILQMYLITTSFNIRLSANRFKYRSMGNIKAFYLGNIKINDLMKRGPVIEIYFWD